MPASNPFAIYAAINPPWELHAGVSVPSYACGPDNQGFKGVVEEGGIYAIEPFNTTGSSGMIKNLGNPNSSNIYRITGMTTSRKARAKGQLKPLGAQMARNLEERYSTLPSQSAGPILCLRNRSRMQTKHRAKASGGPLSRN